MKQKLSSILKRPKNSQELAIQQHIGQNSNTRVTCIPCHNFLSACRLDSEHLNKSELLRWNKIEMIQAEPKMSWYGVTWLLFVSCNKIQLLSPYSKNAGKRFSTKFEKSSLSWWFSKSKFKSISKFVQFCPDVTHITIVSECDCWKLALSSEFQRSIEGAEAVCVCNCQPVNKMPEHFGSRHHAMWNRHYQILSERKPCSRVRDD